MADCSDLNARKKELEEKLAAAEKVERAVEAQAAVDNQTTSGNFRTFSMVDGTKVRIDLEGWYAKAEADNVAMGEDALKEYVRDQFSKNAKPNGSKGENINYAQMDPTDQNVNLLLAMAGQKRGKTEFGEEVAMPFTSEVANQALIQEVALRGGDVTNIAKDLSVYGKKVMRLPEMMVLAKKMKLDSAAYYTDLLDDVGDMMETFGLPPEVKRQVARAGQWAYLFEQVDAVMSRRVGQALRSRNFEMAATRWDEAANGVRFDDIELLDLDKLKPGSLAAQVLEAIESGNAKELKDLARAKRVGALNDVGMNEGNVMTQVRMLNTLRKDNMFLSPSTWIQRNVVAGALVNFSNGMEDFYRTAFKTKDVGFAYQASTVAFARMQSGMGAAFGNAFEALMTGKATFTQAGLKEGVDPNSLINRKRNTIQQLQETRKQINESWSGLFNDPVEAVAITPVAALNLMSLSARYVLGQMSERLTGSTAGYMPGFSLLQAGDEVTRKMGFDWKVGLDSYVNAGDEWDKLATKPGGVSKAEWMAARSNERADAAVFDGLMTDDELTRLRRRAGATQYGDMSNEALRLKIFNDQNGLPNPGTKEGTAGLQRGMEATFTQKIKDPLGQGIQMSRQNPLVGWVIPVFQTPYNGLKWLLERDIYLRLPQQLIMEIRQKAGKDGSKPFTAEELADARAKTVTAMFISATTYGLWQTGVFSDGGSFNPDQRKREGATIPPYSFSVGGTGLHMLMSKLNFSGRSIDLVDLMGLQADMHRAVHENVISEQDLNGFMSGITQSYARILDSKQSLSGVMELLNGLARQAQGNSVNWAEVAASQMSGVLPLSGLLNSGSRSLQDPSLIQESRRELSPTEIAAIEADENWGMFQEFASKVARNYPVLGTAGYQAREFDWLGRKRRRVFGIPYDAVAPFAPILTSDTPLDQWMNKHGLGSKPRPEAKVGGGTLHPSLRGAAATQMTVPEENTYRQEMYSLKGEMPAAAILGSRAVINTGFAAYNIDRYVQGNTMLEALSLLSKDPDYNLDLETPNGPSIAATDLPYAEQSISNRASSLNDPRGVYKVWQAVVTYYDEQALQNMAQQHPDFVKKALANAELKGERIREDREAVMGLSLQ